MRASPSSSTRGSGNGPAAYVQQNLVARLDLRRPGDVVVLDKHRANLDILRRMHPDIETVHADLAEPGSWERHFEGADVVVMHQAQIGGLDPVAFQRNNLDSARNILEAARRYHVPYIVHVSSSVVESVADDHYTNTKKEQERIVLESGMDCVVLRPTLMFGWFDRKHLGWLSRFMKRVSVFPIPGHGRYMRQPLYAGDFSRVIMSCIRSPIRGQVFNISGLERMDYIDIIQQMKRVTGSRTMILSVLCRLFEIMLRVWPVFDRDPPFTADQLKALTAHDEFEFIDWPGIFGVRPTPFARALDETFNHPIYSKIVLEF